MKKIIITILIGLFSCQMPVVNNDVKIENKPFSGKDCKPYNIGKPPSEVILPKLIFFTKSPKEKKEFYSEIKAYINENLLPFEKGERIEIKKENQEKILELQNKLQGSRVAIKSNNLYFINNSDDTNYMVHIYAGVFKIIFNNSCEYEFFKSKNKVIKDDYISTDYFYGIEKFEGEVNIKDEKIDVETVQYLLKEYNKYYIDDIKEIEFSSTNALKTFMMFIRLTTQEAPFYKDMELPYYPVILPQPTGG